METNKYQLIVNDKYNVDLAASDLAALDLIEDQKGQYHLIDNMQSHTIEVQAVDTNKKEVLLSINGKKMQVKIEDMYDRLVKKMGLSVGVAQKVNEIKAPMPGLVLAIEVKEGQEVKEGDPILILEAMKMENVLKAPNDATIKKIHIQQKNTVEKGELLISLE